MEPDLPSLLASWLRHLEAEHRSIHTRRAYSDGVRAFLDWCETAGREPSLDEDTVVDFMNSLHAGGRASNTTAARQAAVRRFSKWLARKGYIGADQLREMGRPRIEEEAVVAITDQELRALLATCHGKGFKNTRDKAMIMLMFETGLRAGEVAGMGVADINLNTRMAVIRGKGGKGRLVRFSPQCNAALDDYLYARRRHRLAPDPALWLGYNSRRFGYSGVYSSIKIRGARIGLDLHPHQLRNTSAVRWLKKGGSPTGLMAQAGWASVDMLRRYIRAAESELAAEEADRLHLGDL